MTDDDPDDPSASPLTMTACIVDQLELYGFTSTGDEPDPRPPADEVAVGAAAVQTIELIAAALQGTRSEPDSGDLLWQIVNGCHRAAERLERLLDENEVAQRDCRREQDGSEVKSVLLERLLAEGEVLIDRRDALETAREAAAHAYFRMTGLPWSPRYGSRVHHRALTAAVIDSRDFLAARRHADRKLLLPPGPKIAFTGGAEVADHDAVWTALDRCHAKHPDMVLLHGGAPKGAELIAARWADHHQVTQIAFKPDWTRHAKAAPFKRNDAMLETLPIGVVVFPGSGIQDNLADKAKKLGIPLFDFRSRGRSARH